MLNKNKTFSGENNVKLQAANIIIPKESNQIELKLYVSFQKADSLIFLLLKVFN